MSSSGGRSRFLRFLVSANNITPDSTSPFFFSNRADADSHARFSGLVLVVHDA